MFTAFLRCAEISHCHISFFLVERFFIHPHEGYGDWQHKSVDWNNTHQILTNLSLSRT